jgi:hypothetical protein
MGGACSRHGIEREKYIQFYSENLKGREQLEDLRVDGKIEWILGK